MKGIIEAKWNGKDDDDFEYAGSNYGSRVLATWLVDESPGLYTAKDILRHAGKTDSIIYCGVGNAFGIYQYGLYVFLRVEYSDSEYHQVLLTVDQAVSLIKAFDALCASDVDDDTFEVEFIAAGKEARQKFEELASAEIGPPKGI
ncbi:MAG: hypothetical protein AB7O39_01040 [Flavobacteriaceae bacterium]